MPLIAFWKTNPQAVNEMRIEQIVATAGDGSLSDGSACSNELRAFLSQIDSDKLTSYADQCLTSKFDKSGLVLQDIVNELARRLDFNVENGRYQGSANRVGADGIWDAQGCNLLVAEVKTTDAYRVSLDRIAEYSVKIQRQRNLEVRPFILIIVGRQDTGELEAQIRGSRHAWDMRLISVEALCKLIKLKVNSEDAETGRKIRGILMPLEYTRLDGLADVLFTAAVENAPEHVELRDQAHIASSIGTAPDAHVQPKTAGQWEFTDAGALQAKRDSIISNLSRNIERPLIKKSRALYWDARHEKRVACTMSKLYDKRDWSRYWYAYHPQWDRFLEEGVESYLALGCMDLDTYFEIPHSVIRAFLPHLNTTVSERGMYWHIHLGKSANGYEIIATKGGQGLSLGKYTSELKRG